MITVDRSGENQIVVAAGANGLLSADEVVESLSAVSLTPADVLLASNEVPFEAVKAAVVAGATAECRVVHNPAPARPLSAMPEGITLLTPNRSEALMLTDAQSVEDAAVQLARTTGAPVAVTVGRDGAILAKPLRQEVELRRIPTAQCQPIDTVGAGDMFNGVTAAALARGRDLATAVNEGVLAATASTQWQGARAPSLRGTETD
jgi:ribokinase